MRLRYLSLLVVSSALLVRADDSIGSVASASSFTLDGTVVNSAGVQSWPLMAGDTVGAGNTPIAIFLRDGSKLNLAAKAIVRLESNGTALSARLTEGAMQYAVATGSTLKVLRGGDAIAERSGSISAQAMIGPFDPFRFDPFHFDPFPFRFFPFPPRISER